MKIAKISICASALALLSIFPAKGETLTIDDCLSMALDANKRIEASTAAVAQAEAMVKSYRANYFPSINASLTGAWVDIDGSLQIEGGNIPAITVDPSTGAVKPTGAFVPFPGIEIPYKVGPVFSAGVDLTQPIYTGGKIPAAVAAARHTAEMARSNKRLTRVEVAFDVSKAYADVVRAGKLAEVARAYRDLVDELEANFDAAVRHGMRHANDRMKVQVRRNEADLNILKAENGIRLAKMNLCRLIGLPIISDIEVVDSFPAVDIPAEVDASLALTDRPEWSILNESRLAQEQKVKIAKSEMLPTIGLKAAYMYNHGFEVNHEPFLNEGSFAALLNVKIPIFHFGEHSSKVKAEKAALKRIESENADKFQLMELEMRKAFATLTEADAAVRLTRAALVQAAENMRLSRAMYDQGMETLADLLQSQLLWQQASQQQISAGFDRFTAYIDYLRTSGRLLK